MSANGGMTKEQVKKNELSEDCSVNGSFSTSSPIYGGGHRTMAPTGRSSAGDEKESGFQGAPNSKTGRR